MRTPQRRMTLLATTAAATAALVTAGLMTAGSAQAAAGCQVAYSVASQWPGGFTGNVTVTNLGDPVSGWTLRWSYGAGQQVTQAWSATVTQSGSTVTATNVDYNGSLATNGSASFGFNGDLEQLQQPGPDQLHPQRRRPAPAAPPPRPPDAPRAPPTTPTDPRRPRRRTSRPAAETGLVGWATQNGGTTGGGSAPADHRHQRLGADQRPERHRRRGDPGLRHDLLLGHAAGPVQQDHPRQLRRDNRRLRAQRQR